jgi:hypothetical protein
MKRPSVSANWFLFIMIGGLLDGSVAFSASESITDEHVASRTHRISSEETWLNFRIEAAVEHASPSGCSVDQKIERHQSMLDPQLSVSGKDDNLAPINPDQCKETEFILPMNQ